jgi:hypothetical protein
MNARDLESERCLVGAKRGYVVVATNSRIEGLGRMPVKVRANSRKWNGRDKSRS